MHPTQQAAELLDEALLSHRPVDPVRALIGSHDLAAAYRVQSELTRRRTARGARVVGRKVGLTSPAVQAQLGVDQPDLGVLFDEMRVEDGAVVDVARLIAPKVEAEVAFVLGADLDGDLDGDAGADRVAAAVETLAPALEVVDSRVRDWDITIGDTVADNGSSALFVLGPARPAGEVVAADVVMTLEVDGRTASSGDGRACLGDPLLALTWLARTASAFGEPLRAGDVVLSGALGPMVPVTGGEHVVATIDPLGTVAVRFGGHEGDAR